MAYQNLCSILVHQMCEIDTKAVYLKSKAYETSNQLTSQTKT